MMKKRPTIPRLETGVRNLDDLLQGGLPAGSVTVLAGSPGAGKTVLAEQICFHNASPTSLSFTSAPCRSPLPRRCAT